MWCDVDQDKFSALQSNDDEDIEQVKANGWGNEQVHGGDVGRMVTHEGAPPRGGRSASLDHILRDAGLSDLKAELEQLAVDARRSPTAYCQRSSAGSARAGPRRFAVGLQGNGISNTNTGGSRLGAIARGSRGEQL